MANRNWIRPPSMEDVQRHRNNYQKQLLLEAQRRRVNEQLDLLNFPKPSDDTTRCPKYWDPVQKDWVIPLVCGYHEYFHSESFHSDSFYSETRTARSPKITTTISTTFTRPFSTTEINFTVAEAGSERIPYFVIILGSIAIVLSIFILAMILFFKFKRTEKATFNFRNRN